LFASIAAAIAAAVASAGMQQRMRFSEHLATVVAATFLSLLLHASPEASQ